MSNLYNLRPTCCNRGCKKPCMNSGKSGATGRIIYRPYCAHCHNAGRGLNDYAKGVTPIKKDFCENSDGRFGFKCFSKGKKMLSLMLDLDHINGNHHDNRPRNFQTLCKCCHAYKTKFYGDNAQMYKYIA